MPNALPKPSLRERQNDVTRDLIVDALIELLEDEGVFDFSFFALARRSGISVRTIYRYFPTREALFDAVSQRVNARIGFREYPTTREGVVELVKELFPAFDRDAGLILAQMKTGLGRQVRAHAQRGRLDAIVQAVAKTTPNLPVERQRDVAGVIACLLSADAWLRLRTVMDVSGERSGAAIAWAIETLFAAAEKENGGAAKSVDAGKKPAKKKPTGKGDRT